MTRRWRAKPWLRALLLHAAVLCALAVEVEHCKDKKIFILDLESFSDHNCTLDELTGVNPANGVIYFRRLLVDKKRKGVSHQYGMHSSPWYLVEAIKHSPYATNNIDEADVVFVNNYCYYTRWLAFVHSKGRLHEQTPGDDMIAAFAQMVITPRFKRNQGSDYVFFDPHPGFVAGNAGSTYWPFICNHFRHSMHIVVERGQRNMCWTYWEMEKKLVIVPYQPNTPNEASQYANWEAPLKPLVERSLLLYSRASCAGFGTDEAGQTINIGKKMRHELAQVMANAGSDVQVQCTDAEFGRKPVAFKDMLKGMQNSKFCLVLPGDSQSSRRISEMFMAGCIPVFAGPPFAAMPLAQDVNYSQAALMYNVTHYHDWMTQDFQWQVHDTQRAWPQEAWFWVPDAGYVPWIPLESISEIIPSLRSIAPEKLNSLFQAVDAHRQLFVYYNHLTKTKSAVNAILSHMCHGQ